MINKRRAFICGISGSKLKKKEISFLKKYKPWGIILFSRNLKTIKQSQNLTKSIRKVFYDDKYPILIDEEGGRVSRLNKFIDSSIFSGEFFGNLYKKDLNKFYLYSKVYVKQISYLLNTLGINLNTIPILDIKRNHTHSVIGNRAYSKNYKNVSKIGEHFIKLFHRNKIATVMKHIPGHGLSTVDSHKNTPFIRKNIKYLIKRDFFPFRCKKSIFSMTAHIIFEKIDPNNCVTHSKKMIELIRKLIGFKSLVISDDISMKALKFSIADNTKKAFTAGCNLVLHCNGNLNQMIKVAENSPIVNKFIIKKTEQFKEIIR
mgnify:CR=1 FL=1|tara:strand:+ start:1771 stop:2721 length:951 start_codon:yes stop_codon:yes gene_type:complete